MNIQEVLDEQINNTQIVKINKKEVKVAVVVSAETFMEFVDVVVGSSFDDEGNYKGAYQEIATRYAIVKYLTNINVDEMSANDVYDLSNQKWFGKIMAVIKNTDYWSSLNYAISEELSNNTPFNTLCKTLTKAVNDFSNGTTQEAIDALSDIASKINVADNKELVEAIVQHSKSE